MTTPARKARIATISTIEPVTRLKRHRFILLELFQYQQSQSAQSSSKQPSSTSALPFTPALSLPSPKLHLKNLQPAPFKPPSVKCPRQSTSIVPCIFPISEAIP